MNISGNSDLPPQNLRALLLIRQIPLKSNLTNKNRPPCHPPPVRYGSQSISAFLVPIESSLRYDSDLSSSGTHLICDTSQVIPFFVQLDANRSIGSQNFVLPLAPRSIICLSSMDEIDLR